MANQYKNKVVYGGSTLIDLTSDTVAPETLVAGEIAHDKSGAPITGTLVIQHYYTGTTDPLPELGVNGDIYLKVVS